LFEIIIQQGPFVKGSRRWNQGGACLECPGKFWCIHCGSGWIDCLPFWSWTRRNCGKIVASRILCPLVSTSILTGSSGTAIRFIWSGASGR